MKKWICIFAALSLCAACAPKSSDSDNSEGDSASVEELIVGGHLATKKSEVGATTVSLLDSEAGTLCTASILSEDVAITAAHCVSGNPNNMELSFGPRSAGREARQVEDIAVASPWARHQNENFDNGDIALVKFTGGLPAGFKPASLMKGSHHLSDGEIVTLAGFGTSNGAGAGAGRLRSVDVKIAKAKYSRTEVTVDQTKGHGACHGDSGGPAFIQDNNGNLLLWGVTSRGIDDPQDHCAGEAVYTRIQPYVPWINKIVRGWKK